ncbi:MAG: hypothetical protein OHK93_005827 [Ramalina farinacea]|uniref:MFS transporter n=1 Tax=Ramalina farinacea TaxID=258253 RepID=A0AA43QHF2_9LECA|nr:hypothetical protein [Ramalina farinacea]
MSRTDKADTTAMEKYATSSPSISAVDVEDDRSYAIKDKALLRKLDRKLLPALTLLYLLSFLDRSNVANARVEGLVKDLHMSGYNVEARM